MELKYDCFNMTTSGKLKHIEDIKNYEDGLWAQLKEIKESE